MKTILLATIVALLTPLIITTAFAQVPVPTFETAYFKGNNGTYQIPYLLINATLKTSLLDLPAKELFFEINPTSNGQLTVVLPRTIIDSKNGQEDIPYFASIYDIRSLGGPIRITPQELNEKDQRIVQINFTSHISEIAIAGTWFAENNSTNPSHWNPFNSFSPLQQYNKGIVAEDVKCNLGFQLVIKSEDDSPACVRSDTAQILLERGWAKEIISNGAEVTALNLYLSTNSTIVNFGHTLGIDIYLNNTRSEQLTLAVQNHWIRNDLSISSCSNLPVGIAILKGYYTEQNITDASSLWLFPNLPCPMPLGIKSYTFQPLSNVATRECDLPFSCHDSIAIEGHLAISSYLNGTGSTISFQLGNYTVAGGDEWGDIAIKHFVVTNSTS